MGLQQSRLLVIVLVGIVLTMSPDLVVAHAPKSESLMVCAYVLPRMTFCVDGTCVRIKSNVNWTACATMPSGETLTVSGSGVREVAFPSGARDITVLYD